MGLYVRGRWVTSAGLNQTHPQRDITAIIQYREGREKREKQRENEEPEAEEAG